MFTKWKGMALNNVLHALIVIIFSIICPMKLFLISHNEIANLISPKLPMHISARAEPSCRTKIPLLRL